MFLDLERTCVSHDDHINAPKGILKLITFSRSSHTRKKKEFLHPKRFASFAIKLDRKQKCRIRLVYVFDQKTLHD